jgi:hypothetical protein
MAAGSMLIRGVQFDIVTERRPHSSSFETDTSDQATADEFFSEDEPTPPQGTDVVDLPFDVPLKPDRSVLPPPEVVPHERFDGPSSEDTAVLPVVKVDVAADVDGPLEDLPVPAGRISPVSPVNPISPDPPDPFGVCQRRPQRFAQANRGVDTYRTDRCADPGSDRRLRLSDRRLFRSFRTGRPARRAPQRR